MDDLIDFWIEKSFSIHGLGAFKYLFFAKLRRFEQKVEYTEILGLIPFTGSGTGQIS